MPTVEDEELIREADNPPITPLLRFFTLIEAFVLVVVGGALCFSPALVGPLWPWETGPPADSL